MKHRDNLRQLIVDATICVQKEDIDLPSLESWIEVSILRGLLLIASFPSLVLM